MAFVVLALAVVPTPGCARGAAAGPVPPLTRVVPEAIIIRTTSFAFHLGAGVDPTWPAKSEKARAELGRALSVLLDEEDTAVPLLARQLGVAWPSETVDFDVVLRDAEGRAPCDAKLPRLLEVGRTPARLFFACVLERSFARLAPDSSLYRAIAASRPSIADPGGEASRLYACVTAYAVSALMVAQTHDEGEQRATEEALGEECAPRALAWVGHAWIKRVRGVETAEAFGARAAGEVEGEP